jgi:hypothetical protein
MKIKLFLEFVKETEKSRYLDLTYGDILKLFLDSNLITSLSKLEEFESYLDSTISPGKSFRGSFAKVDRDSKRVIQAQVPIYDKIETLDQYRNMYENWFDSNVRPLIP